MKKNNGTSAKKKKTGVHSAFPNISFKGLDRTFVESVFKGIDKRDHFQKGAFLDFIIEHKKSLSELEHKEGYRIKSKNTKRAIVDYWVQKIKKRALDSKLTVAKKQLDLKSNLMVYQAWTEEGFDPQYFSIAPCIGIVTKASDKQFMINDLFDLVKKISKEFSTEKLDECIKGDFPSEIASFLAHFNISKEFFQELAEYLVTKDNSRQKIINTIQHENVAVNQLNNRKSPNCLLFLARQSLEKKDIKEKLNWI